VRKLVGEWENRSVTRNPSRRPDRLSFMTYVSLGAWPSGSTVYEIDAVDHDAQRVGLARGFER
jgi:hypothetical protein